MNTIKDDIYNYLIAIPELATYNITEDNIAFGDLPDNVERAIYYRDIGVVSDIYQDTKQNDRWRFYISTDKKSDCYAVREIIEEKFNHFNFEYMGATFLDYIQKVDKQPPLKQDNGFYLAYIDFNINYTL